GVGSVVAYPLPEGKSGQHTVDILQKRVEQLGATKTGSFTIDCETYQAQSIPQQRLVHVLHNSEQPASCFSVLDTGTCLVADSLFDLLMLKLKGFYVPRKNAKVESRGQRYELGDFLIKIGSVVLGQNTSFKGILVEVEYRPCVVANECWGLLKEFMHGFLGNICDTPPNHLKTKMDSVYMPADTIMQYLEHFNNLRKAAAQPPR
ncbi:hypothetical protein NP493_162g05000, partial [Ridgeia piscesae]